MNTILLSALSFSWLVFLFEGYLDLRQRKTFKKSDFPKELEGVVTIESVVKSRAYGLDKNTFGFITGTFGQVENTFILLLGGMPFLWYTSVDIVSRFGYSEANEIMVTCTFALLAMIYEMVVHLGFELYSTFVIEQRHGFNKQTLALFAADKLKAIGLSIVIGGPLLAVLITLIQWGGPHFYIYVWLFLVAFQLVMLLVYPTLIAPLFNKFEPLPDGELRSAIEALAKSIGFPLTKLFVVDGSRRSGHSNAYFFGLWKWKRIVLYDTLIGQASVSEVVAVLAHELGHWKMNHTVKHLLIGQLHSFVSFYLFGLFISWTALYTAFGFSSQPTIIGLILFFTIVMGPGRLLGHTRNKSNQTGSSNAPRASVA
eukprot:TRINITY_DN2042_c0_g1_i1.p1 TRINITY_DN2042_c0_g1~~TRINITY_DN2042_c0_g1_i1.p1  ORF type:complete len:370 (+),score=119.90 TRINITY_DN2042_c0_g1_i1:94-1203(+)